MSEATLSVVPPPGEFRYEPFATVTGQMGGVLDARAIYRPFCEKGEAAVYPFVNTDTGQLTNITLITIVQVTDTTFTFQGTIEDEPGTFEVRYDFQSKSGTIQRRIVNPSYRTRGPGSGSAPIYLVTSDTPGRVA